MIQDVSRNAHNEGVADAPTDTSATAKDLSDFANGEPAAAKTSPASTAATNTAEQASPEVGAGNDEVADVVSPTGSGAEDAEPLSLEEVMAQRDSYLNDLQRVRADWANFKRRAAIENQETAARALAGLAKKMLTVLDACDAAVAHGAQDVAPIYEALVAVLAKEGLSKLDAVGEPFDPNFHEAVAHEPGEGEAVIVEVLRAGYHWNHKVLRPAMVKVKG